MTFALSNMVNAIYFFLAILIALWGLAHGFRLGITRQMASFLGFAFGAVFARILAPELSVHFQWAAALSQAPEFSELTVNLICAVTIYCVVFALFSLLSPLLNLALSVIPVGMFNRLIGAFFSLVKNLLWLSLAFNLLLCLSPASRLIGYEKANDGNLIAAVMALTPAILGCYGAEDFAHFNQLKEAKSISCNFHSPPNVIIS